MNSITAMSTEALLFRQTFNRVCKDSPYSCRVAWQQGTCIHAVIRCTQDTQLTETTFVLSVANDYEVAAHWIQASYEKGDTDE